MDETAPFAWMSSAAFLLITLGFLAILFGIFLMKAGINALRNTLVNCLYALVFLVLYHYCISAFPFHVPFALILPLCVLQFHHVTLVEFLLGSTSAFSRVRILLYPFRV